MRATKSTVRTTKFQALVVLRLPTFRSNFATLNEYTFYGCVMPTLKGLRVYNLTLSEWDLYSVSLCSLKAWLHSKALCRPYREFTQGFYQFENSALHQVETCLLCGRQLRFLSGYGSKQYRYKRGLNAPHTYYTGNLRVNAHSYGCCTHSSWLI